MKRRLDDKIRYLQIAFNYDVHMVRRLLPTIAHSPRILIEAGTPFIKLEGMDGVRAIRSMWDGHLVADLKVSDGALGEVEMAHRAGATAATVLGDAPTETVDLFIAACNRRGMISMIDMIGVDDPLDVLRPLKTPPDVVVLHRGRDEENVRGKVIQYKHVTRIRSKYDVVISAAGGVDLREARSAIFNGANLVVVNLVHPRCLAGDPYRPGCWPDDAPVLSHHRVILFTCQRGTLAPASLFFMGIATTLQPCGGFVLIFTNKSVYSVAMLVNSRERCLITAGASG